MESVFVVTAVIAVTEFFKRIQARDVYGALTIVLAAVIGGLAGFFGVEGLTVATGLIAGLGGAGIVTTATRIG